MSRAMPLHFLSDLRLYTEYEHYRATFCWPGGGAEPAQRLLYHCYWSGVLGRHHELSLKSLLLTQSPPYEVWVWMPGEDLERNRDFVASYAGLARLSFREYAPAVEARGTVFERHTALLTDELWPRSLGRTPRSRRPTAISDGLRLLVLGKYGGVYFDLDTLFLRDLRALCNVCFFYQWSNQPFGSNALSHFHAGAASIWALAKRSIRLGTCHPAALLRFGELANLPGDVVVFPSFLFDPAWIAHDTGTSINGYCNRFDDFFRASGAVSLAEFFPGSYAYDWHNRWDQPIRPDTLVGRLYDEVTAGFAARRPA
jgi:hypothetical protein